MKTTLDSSCDLKDLELLLVIPEHTVYLPVSGKGSQNDAWVLASNQNGLISIAIEGKVDESFDKTLGCWKDWSEDPTETRTNKEHLLREICKILDIEVPSDKIRYQLLHRCASAVLAGFTLSCFKSHVTHPLFQSREKVDGRFSKFCTTLWSNLQRR